MEGTPEPEDWGDAGERCCGLSATKQVPLPALLQAQGLRHTLHWCSRGPVSLLETQMKL